MKFTYLMTDGVNYKIGQSSNPEQRLKGLKTGNRNIELLCYGNGIAEKKLHSKHIQKRISGEWFKLNTIEVRQAREYIEKGEIILSEDNNLLSQILNSIENTKSELECNLITKLRSNPEKYPETKKWWDNEVSQITMSI